MSVRLPTLLVLMAVPLSIGCTTMQNQHRDSMREQSEIQRLRTEVERLKARVEGLEAAQDRVYGRIDDLQSSADANQGDVAQRMARMETSIRDLDAAREKDRQVVIDALTKKISGLMRSRPAPGTPSQSGYEHVVQPGETLSEIASAYNVSINAVVKANNLKNPDSLRAGQKLFIPE